MVQEEIVNTFFRLTSSYFAYAGAIYTRMMEARLQEELNYLKYIELTKPTPTYIGLNY